MAPTDGDPCPDTPVSWFPDFPDQVNLPGATPSRMVPLPEVGKKVASLRVMVLPVDDATSAVPEIT